MVKGRRKKSFFLQDAHAPPPARCPPPPSPTFFYFASSVSQREKVRQHSTRHCAGSELSGVERKEKTGAQKKKRNRSFNAECDFLNYFSPSSSSLIIIIISSDLLPSSPLLELKIAKKKKTF